MTEWKESVTQKACACVRVRVRQRERERSNNEWRRGAAFVFFSFACIFSFFAALTKTCLCYFYGSTIELSLLYRRWHFRLFLHQRLVFTFTFRGILLPFFFFGIFSQLKLVYTLYIKVNLWTSNDWSAKYGNCVGLF